MPTEGQGTDSQNSDVKETAKASSSKAETKEALQAKETSEEVEIEEGDLKDLDEGQKVPYSRFKQVNEKAREKDRALEAYKATAMAQQQALVAELQALRSLKSEATANNEDQGVLDLTVDPNEKVIKSLVGKIADLEGKLTNLSNKTSQESLRLKVDEAIKKFPKANRVAVMGILKFDPTLDVEEIAEGLHQQVMAERTEGIKELIERKKAKKKEAILPTNETGRIVFKENERPKTVKEASEKLKAFMSKLTS